MKLRSCSTRLCLRLCIRAGGAMRGLAVRNTAVPGTITGGLSVSRSAISCIGTASAASFACNFIVPRSQVTMNRMTTAANISGMKPPSSTFRMLA
ncbi:hypothetical protein D9M68_943030 [compost metagenome]